MAPMAPSQLANPLASVEQLANSGSQLDGVPADLERSIIYAGCRLTQAAGVLLRLPQEIIAQAIVIFTRFWIGTEGGSLREFGAKDVSAATLFLIAKPSAYSKSPRSIINVYAFLDSLPTELVNSQQLPQHNDPDSYYVSEGTYQAQRTHLTKVEAYVLRVLGFQTHVALPYTLCITYLQTLGVVPGPRASAVSKRAFAYLNSSLLNPQLLYLTHQPCTIATAAIYLAAREAGEKLAYEWWEVFDTDREELGFLAVAMLSLDGFAREEKEKWGKRKVPLTVDAVNAEIEDRRMLNGNA